MDSLRTLVVTARRCTKRPMILPCLSACMPSRPHPVRGMLVTLDTIPIRKGWTEKDMKRLLCLQLGYEVPIGVPVVYGHGEPQDWIVELWEFGYASD